MPHPAKSRTAESSNAEPDIANAVTAPWRWFGWASAQAIADATTPTPLMGMTSQLSEPKNGVHAMRVSTSPTDDQMRARVANAPGLRGPFGASNFRGGKSRADG